MLPGYKRTMPTFMCLNVEMKPEAVLTEDQRKVRFRNAIKKKETRKTQNVSR